MNIQEAIKQLKGIEKLYWNINLYDTKLNWIKTIWVNNKNYPKIIIDFYPFN